MNRKTRHTLRAFTAAMILAPLAAIAAPARAVTNLLPDGGFESGQWKLTKWDRGDGTLEFSPDARTGAKAVKLSGISDAKARVKLLAHSGPIDVQAGRQYVLSVWHRSTANTTPTVSISTLR